jgi:hypothetical protein
MAGSGNFDEGRVRSQARSCQRLVSPPFWLNVRPNAWSEPMQVLCQLTKMFDFNHLSVRSAVKPGQL